MAETDTAPDTSAQDFGEQDTGMTEVRPAIDADDVTKLQRDPGNEDGKLDIALDETFPTSDPPSNTQPGKGKDPAPSSGYDPDAEAARLGD